MQSVSGKKETRKPQETHAGAMTTYSSPQSKSTDAASIVGKGTMVSFVSVEQLLALTGERLYVGGSSYIV